MPYQVRLSHIHPDYSVDPPPTESWSAVVEDDDALVVMMNRVAITSSQNPSHEYPVLDVVTGSTRATITVIGGQLYYTDPNAPNRSNIKVVADAAIQLLHGSSLEAVMRAEAALEQEDRLPTEDYRPAGMSARFRAALLVVLLFVLTVTIIRTWKELSYQPSLVPVFEFTPGAITEEGIRAYSGIYVEGYQEGGQVLELTNEGQFLLYEMWYSAEDAGFTLRQIESLPLRLGSQDAKPALMAGDFYLLLPRSEERMLFGGVLFSHHMGSLKTLGKIERPQSGE